MELISKLLFWVANSLLIPDIIILLCLFVRSLILIGGTYNMYMTKRKNDKALDQLIKDARIDDLKAGFTRQRQFTIYGLSPRSALPSGQCRLL